MDDLTPLERRRYESGAWLGKPIKDDDDERKENEWELDSDSSR